MPETIDGLPLHPLIVHLPIVFGPILGLLSLGLLNPRWRPVLIRPLAILGVITAVAAILAAESGEWLASHLVDGPPAGLPDHQEAAELFRNLSIVFALLLIGMAMFYERLKGGLQTAAAVVLALIGLASLGAVIKAGHEGAKLAWGDEIQRSGK
ncbi:MAG: hypothetical protein J7513_05845 [Solirubrobacteraceae bacterium]|nr:hypothetical protein [Solirubrobacteraceae bacterium]